MDTEIISEFEIIGVGAVLYLWIAGLALLRLRLIDWLNRSGDDP